MTDAPVGSCQTPSPLAVPMFLAIWLAAVLANIGGVIQTVGASWMMTSMHASSEMVALVQGVTTLPIMLLSLLAGALADSVDRRGLMLSAQIFMFISSGALAALSLTGALSPGILLGFTFALGCGMALYLPAWQASVGELVPRAALPAAVSLNSMSFNIARTVGPAIGGALVAGAGSSAAFIVNACSYLGLIAVLLRWKAPPTGEGFHLRELPEVMLGGLKYVAMTKVRSVMVRAGVFSVAASSILALTPLVARDLLGGGALVYGVLLGGFGGGAVVGLISWPASRRRFGTEHLSRIGAISMGSAFLVVAASPWLALSIPAMVVAGAAWVVSVSTFNVTVQLSAPRWVVARALSVYQMFAFGGLAVGSWLAGIAADRIGLSQALIAAAVLHFASLILGRLMPLPDPRPEDSTLAELWSEPSHALEIAPEDGPLSIEIEYRVAQDDMGVFSRAMRERRRIRARDGARGWNLWRDLADSDVWIERYQVAHWRNYVRHNERRTIADKETHETLLRFTCAKGPVVRRLLRADLTRNAPSKGGPTFGSPGMPGGEANL
ncbi:MAG: MFS transporter [Brevundimonas sp.]|jgi:MFS family permease|uniref:MFS transporter n=1 Tax=Brevundimonas sp. TaxID=1871086 RepID=UPI0025BDC8B0|nr:MFS transporter [Brevundimonas sp.]MCH4269679.1 MFS transporter [Brevundimonas sp.]